MTETSGNYPSAWHPDPFGRYEYRYFNGSTWTEWVSNAGVQSTDPPVREVEQPPKRPQVALAEGAATGSPSLTWPFAPKPVVVRGRTLPVEVVLVASVFGLAGIWLLWEVRSIIAFLPDELGALFSSNAFEFALAWLLLLFILILAYIILGLLGTAYLLLRVDPIGRALSVVVCALLFSIMAAAQSTPRTIVLITLVATACAVVLFWSPHAREAFKNSPRRGNRPQSVVLSQTILVTVFTLIAALAVMYLPGIRFIGELSAKSTIAFLLMAVSAALGLNAYRRLSLPDRRARRQATLACSLLLVSFALSGDASTGILVPLVILVAIVGPLWLATGSRVWYGDKPLDFG